MIPKTIWQIGMQEYEDLPSYIKMCAESWQDSNPSWTYRYMTNSDAYDFIKNNYGNEYARLYLKAKIPMCQADFWRYLVLHQHGGVYVDLDMLCMSPIEEWFNLDTDLSLFNSAPEEVNTWKTKTYDQWMIGAKKESLAMLAAINAVANKINLAEDGRVSYHDTGSLVFTEAINNSGVEFFINDAPPESIIHYTGSRLWSEGWEGKNTAMVYPWARDRHSDIKMFGNAYNSTDGVS